MNIEGWIGTFIVFGEYFTDRCPGILSGVGEGLLDNSCRQPAKVGLKRLKVRLDGVNMSCMGFIPSDWLCCTGVGTYG